MTAGRNKNPTRPLDPLYVEEVILTLLPPTEEQRAWDKSLADQPEYIEYDESS